MRSILERFEAYVSPEPNTGCWLWTGALRNGYGVIGLGAKWLGIDYAHRVSWLMFRGLTLITIGFELCHRCDMRSCVNPDHLFLGTRSENIDDAKKKGRLERLWARGPVGPGRPWRGRRKEAA